MRVGSSESNGVVLPDFMARAAQVAAETTTRRFDSSKDKGSAASAVACFMRDLITLRQGLEMIRPSSDGAGETPTVQPVIQPAQSSFANNSSSLRGGFAGQRNSLIRRPSPIYVDADSNK